MDYAGVHMLQLQAGVLNKEWVQLAYMRTCMHSWHWGQFLLLEIEFDCLYAPWVCVLLLHSFFVH